MFARRYRLALLCIVSFVPAVAQQDPGGAAVGGVAVKKTLDRYCVSCHNQKTKTAGLILDSMDLAQVPSKAEVWEKVSLKLRSGTMPPAGMPRPDAALRNTVATWIETQIDQDAAQHPYVGRPLLHRLNRTEYGNAVRDVLGLEVDASTLLPPDDAAFGFDTVADTLGLSPSLQERYLSAAMKIAALAVGDPKQLPASKTWRVRQDLSQDQHVEGLPLGTEGGTAFRYNFPLDGEYRFQATLYRTNLNIVRGLQTRREVEFSVDGKRVHLATIGGPEDIASLFEHPTETSDAVNTRMRFSVHLTAGPHNVAAAFVQTAALAEPVRLQPFLRSSVDNFDWAGHPHLESVTIAGPYQSTGPGDTPSRRRLLTCRPARASEENTCAKQILTTLIRHAYREPAAEADVLRALQFYENGRKEGGFEQGIQFALERILASPKFLFRSEETSHLTDLELASRLSFLLWSSVPDDRLIELGAKNRLSDPATLDREVRRMLADPKEQALVSNFAGQWLQLRNLRNVQPNTDRFPDFDDNLRQSFRTETEMLFQSIIAEDRSVIDLLNADYTFLNERLARHYGVPGIYGSRFRRVPVTQDERRGLLGQGSILALTSHAERTSPVVRGKWILENLQGLAVSPPPANVPPLKERQDGDAPKTMREQMAEHRANPVCASCHKTLDPIGFALENFDAVGAWRSNDSGLPIDASGELAGGAKVNGVVELRRTLLDQPAMFASTLTEKLMIYGLGRGLDYRDAPEVRAIVHAAAKDNYKFSAILLGILRSPEFQKTDSGEQR